ncbi:response regulator [Massilia sp. B-10]|nr:response regulator [Massilia sp. B-10]
MKRPRKLCENGSCLKNIHGTHNERNHHGPDRRRQPRIAPDGAPVHPHARLAWTVAEAATGEEALAKVAAGTPALILIDVNMPGIGGLAAAEQLRQQCPGAHISLVTANVQNATRNRANELGIGFMEKPITENKIHALIDALSLD